MDAPVILLYDGECAFCSRGVRFLARHDPEARIRYASLQSATGRRLAQEHGLDAAKLDTVVLLEPDRGASTQSTAALRAALHTRGPWPILARMGLAAPRALRDPVYAAIARRRHRLARDEACPTPDARVRDRMIE